MTLKVETDAGTWLAWGTCPSGLLGGDFGIRGCRVRFDAKLTRSDRDEHFAFFKRPTKPAILTIGDEGKRHLDRLREELAHDDADDDCGKTEWRAEWRTKVEAEVARLEGMVA